MSRVRFETADGISLEGELRRPDGSPRGTAVLCHPHPRYGGSKDHPLLWALRNDLAGRRGLAVLAFNFRGVMGSEGAHGGGEAELADVAAAVDRVRREALGATALVGWSFGAAVGLGHAATDDRVRALVLIAIPAGGGRPAWIVGGADPAAVDIPVLLVAGDRDDVCPVPVLHQLAERLPRAETLIVPGTGHLFARREREVAESVGGFVERALQEAR